AQIAHLEVALLQVLKRMLRMQLGVAGQGDLAVLADDAAVGGVEHTGVVAMLDTVLDGEFGVAEIEADAQAPCLIEEHLGGWAGHLAFEPGVELRFVFDPPVREERSEGAFGEDDEIAAAVARLAHLLDQPGNDLAPRGLPRNGPALGRSDGEESWH